MRKQTKLVAVLSAAALLAIGASMTSFAAGWTEEDGTWVYYDKDGYQVTDSWKKSGNYWYYLDEDGYMATSRLIENSGDSDDIYYVDETGRMVANRWVELENEDYYDSSDDEDEPETVWYYFQNSGKAYKTSGDTSFKTINGKKYAFDADGQMLFGWVTKDSTRVTGDTAYREGGLYYCGDANDGARVSGDWRYLYIDYEGPNADDSEDDNKWFYFGTNGKKVTDTDDKKINGKRYAFDDNGVMIGDWNKTSSSATAVAGYYGDEVTDGARKTGWFEAVPSEGIDESANEDDSAKWFYGNSNGSLVVAQIKTINGKKYAFNAEGEMMSGLWKLVTKTVDGKVTIDFEDEATTQIDDEADLDLLVNGDGTSVYYFGDSDDGAMKTGNQTVEVDGDNYQFLFGKDGGSKGKGQEGEKNKALYVQGKKVKADSDYKYQMVNPTTGEVVSVDVDAEHTENVGKYYLVNTSGRIMTSTGSEYKDTDGFVYKVNASGLVVSKTVDND